MSAIVLNNKFAKDSELALPENFSGHNPHNLYLYVKSYQAGIRANTASTKTRAEVRGGGKKPWAQKGRGGARAGSTRSPVWVGGGQVFGPKSNRNYDLKVNKKQKRIALEFALNELSEAGKLFIVDNIEVASGKTKDAKAIFTALDVRDALFVKEIIDENTFMAFRNLQSCYLVEGNELNAFLAATYRSVVIEKAVWEQIVEGAK
ncbi:MAG: 50S ribosomal protein L4 [Helicobacteraceae bacterium]|jgi:large subunit ribosomal protein L4|nr:50S ribosomal protein L4 [Helicobacteraceae bacterium]